MRFGPGRAPKKIEVGAVREVSDEELANTPNGREDVVKKFKEHHHHIARLFASGLRTPEVAAIASMSHSRVALLHQDRAFQELIREYKDSVDQTWRDSYSGLMTEINEGLASAVRNVNNQLFRAEEEGKDLPIGQLVRVISDFADRAGYAKRIAVDVNHTFAAKLDRARERSQLKTINATPERVVALPAPRLGDGPERDAGDSDHLVAPPVRESRRA